LVSNEEKNSSLKTLSTLDLLATLRPVPLHQCSFVDHRGVRVVYRRYASLFFLVGVDRGSVAE